MEDGRFDHRVSWAAYSDDDIRVRLRTERSESWVSEELWLRLIEIDRAYRLHILTVLADVPLHEPASINTVQAAGLVDEVEFLRSLLATEEAIQGLVSAILPLLVEAARYGNGNALVIEGP